MSVIQRITPCLWFDTSRQKKLRRSTSLFFPIRKWFAFLDTGKRGFQHHGRPLGSVLIVEFDLDGQRYTALNGGPHFKFNEAVSFAVNCDTQEEIDYYWSSLSEGGDSECTDVRVA